MTALLLVALALAGPGEVDDAARVEAVTSALGEAQPRLHRCWERAAAADWRVEGQVAVRARVGAGGRIDSVELDGKLGHAELEACVREAFAGISVGTAFAPGDSIELPLELKAEPNVTLRQKDAPSLKLGGTQATARILIDEVTSGATKASLTFIDIPAGARWMRPGTEGTAVIYVNKGRAKIPGGAAVTNGDVIIFGEGSAHPMMASVRTELLVLLTPAGGEQAYRNAPAVGSAGKGPEPRVVKRASGQKLSILGGKGEATLLVEKDKAYVGMLKVAPGTTVPEHSHGSEAEIIYLLEGKGEMVVDGSSYPVEPFMAIYLPPGVKHSFTASTATTSVEAVQFYAPSGPEQRFKDAK